MRALSARQAQRCEDAANPRCRCRCGGALHGAHRGRVESLELSDPHHPGVDWVQLRLFEPPPRLRLVEPIAWPQTVDMPTGGYL